MSRSSNRHVHIQESKHLLWELVTVEPTILRCFNIIEATALSQGIFCKIDGEPCSDDFKDFLNDHYHAFVRQSLRAMYTYGFVPFYLHRLESEKEIIPIVVPHGTFDWTVEVVGSAPQGQAGEYEGNVFLGHTL